MKITKIAILTLILVSFFICAYAQEKTWRELTNQAFKLYVDKKYAEAIAVTKKTLEIAKKEFGPESLEVAESLGNLAALYELRHHWIKARWLSERAKAIRRKQGFIGVPLGIESEAFFDKVAELKGRGPTSAEDSVQRWDSNPRPRCDVDRDYDCDADDLAKIRKHIGNCLGYGKTDYDPFCDIDSDLCITEKDEQAFLQDFDQQRVKEPSGTLQP